MVRDPVPLRVLRLGRNLLAVPLDLHRHVRRKFATTNAGLLYTAKGTAALLVPIANTMQQSSGHWDSVFMIAAGANILASLLAIMVLKPWRKVVVAKSMA